MKAAIAKNSLSIITTETKRAIDNLTDSVMLPALWKIRNYEHFIQGTYYHIDLTDLGTSSIETTNNLFGAQKGRFTSKLSFDLSVAIIGTVILRHNEK